MVRKFINFLVPVILLGAAAYQFRVPISALFRPAPCTAPIPYTLGSFDTKFNISKDYFLSALGEAEAIWEKPYGKELFSYAPQDRDEDTLKINLIYDYRQQATSKLGSLGITVNETRASYENLKAKFTNLKTTYETEKSDFNQAVEAFNQKQETYKKEVDAWNKKGGAPEGEFDRLQRTQKELQNEASSLAQREKNLNSMAEEINALVVVLNRQIAALNLTVEKYNTTNVARGESFEEGVYSSDGETSEIDIYEFSNRQKLVRVLAHELGHALGLAHVDDSKAIMYELNQGNTTLLTKADLAELHKVCRN